MRGFNRLPQSSEAKILPEQALGRGLRRMFRGEYIDEKVPLPQVWTPTARALHGAMVEIVDGVGKAASQCAKLAVSKHKLKERLTSIGVVDERVGRPGKARAHRR